MTDRTAGVLSSRNAKLGFASFFAFMLLHQADKLLIGPLMVPIMTEFGMTNTQWGLVNTGALVVGAAFYPLWGWLYDHFSRPKLLSLASLLWGGSTGSSPDADASLEHTEEVCRQFIDRKINGVFFAPAEWEPQQEPANRRLAESLRQAGIPVVLLDRDMLAFPGRSDLDLVGIDNVAGGYLLAEHLIKLGCERLAFVAHPYSAATVDARIAGVHAALVRHKLEPGPGWVRIGDVADPKFVRPLVAGRQVDAIVCANDYTAAVLMRSAESAGLRVPQDLRVVGFDDVKYATLVTVPLTTIHQPCRDIAIIAFRTMLERLAEPTMPARNIALTPHLVVRESCGAYLPKQGHRHPLRAEKSR